MYKFVRTNTWENVHLWSLQLIDTLYISDHSSYLRHCKSVVPAIIWKPYISVPDKNLSHSTSMVPTTMWQVENLCSRKFLETLYPSVPRNYMRLCITVHIKYLWNYKSPFLEILNISCSDIYIRRWISPVSANIWDSVHRWSQQRLVKLYISDLRNCLEHCKSLVKTTIWYSVQLWSQQIHVKLHIPGTSNYLLNAASLDPGNTWDTLHL